jgi:hypothetical protein
MSVDILSVGILCVTLLTGCSHTDRCGFSGNVTLDGEPVDRGSISFASKSKESRSRSGSRIKMGKFEVSAEKGLLPGKYSVRITSPTPSVPTPGAPGYLGLSTPVERIPPKYNMKTELEVEIDRETDNSFEFDLKTS